MPIYEYRCEACGHTLEAIQKFSDKPLSDCPACAKPALKKCISAPAFRLNGSGWYETDFKTGKKKNLAASEATASGDSAGVTNSSTSTTETATSIPSTNTPSAA